MEIRNVCKKVGSIGIQSEMLGHVHFFWVQYPTLGFYSDAGHMTYCSCYYFSMRVQVWVVEDKVVYQD